ncbi:MAG: hypothetical protein RSC66_06415 [Comamonas sp.]
MWNTDIVNISSMMVPGSLSGLCGGCGSGVDRHVEVCHDDPQYGPPRRGVYPLSMAIRPAALHFLPAVRMRYTAQIMFIPRAFIAGCGDRGAWPWRKPAQLNS